MLDRVYCACCCDLIIAFASVIKQAPAILQHIDDAMLMLSAVYLAGTHLQDAQN